MRRGLLLISFLFVLGSTAWSQSAFTYQGKLTDASIPANGTYDLVFRLFDSSGVQIGSDLIKDNIQVTAGIFTVSLDFGASPFTSGTGDSLEIGVRPGTSTGAFTTLTPRQLLTSSPYAIKSVNTTSADSLSAACALCVTDGHIQSIDGSKIVGTVANASTAGTANSVTGIVQIANGGTGSVTKNFVDLSTNQNVFGNKTFTSAATFNNAVTVAGSNNTLTVDGSLNVGFNVTADQFHGGGDGLTNISGNSIVDNSILASKLVDGSITSAKLAPEVTVAATTNSALLGMLRWDLVGQRNFNVATNPRGIAFDGKNMWVTCGNPSGRLVKLRASDGAFLANDAIGNGLDGIAFDGSNIWVVSGGSNNVMKISASDGQLLGTFATAGLPQKIAFDGANIWISQFFGGVKKLRASDGFDLGTFTAGNSPTGLAFDGANIWVTNFNSANVTKLRSSDGANLGTFPVGSQPKGVAFDGSNVWVANSGSNSVTKLRASDGANLGTFTVSSSPEAVAFDGTNIWVSNFLGSAVTKLRADGVITGVFSTGGFASAIAFDGAHIWVANLADNNVTKIPAFP